MSGQPWRVERFVHALSQHQHQPRWSGFPCGDTRNDAACNPACQSCFRPLSRQLTGMPATAPSIPVRQTRRCCSCRNSFEWSACYIRTVESGCWAVTSVVLFFCGTTSRITHRCGERCILFRDNSLHRHVPKEQPPAPLNYPGWVVQLVVVEDRGQWGRRQKQ